MYSLVGVSDPLTALTAGHDGNSGEELLKPMELWGPEVSRTVQFFAFEPAERWLPAEHVSPVPKKSVTEIWLPVAVLVQSPGV